MKRFFTIKKGRHPYRAFACHAWNFVIRPLSCIICLTLCHAAAAQKTGSLWLAGYDEFPGVPGYGHVQIRVTDDTVLVEPTALAFNFESTMAVMTGPDGSLLFYTNGCEVADRFHQVMPNGNGLNPGDISGLVCPGKGYIVPQGAMILPDPGNPDRYYLLHTGASYDPVRKLRLGPLYFTVVEMAMQNGIGDVSSKNNVLQTGDLGAFTAVRHGNGRDWWVIVPEFGNRVWHTFLLGPDGFSPMPPQTVLLSGVECEKYIGTAASLQGDRLANWGDCKVTALDFDRCAGVLANAMEMPAPTHWIPGGGVAFSPSGRYLYATSQNVLFRADLQPESPGPIRLDTVRFSYDPLRESPFDVPGNTFHALVNGPDGRIYGNIPSRAKHLHALRNPDSDTIAAAKLDFRARGVPLPVSSVRTLPHLPNYRLTSLAGSICDTLGIVGAPELSAIPVAFRIRPNPVRDFLLVDFPDYSGGTLRATLHSVQGMLLRRAEQPGGQLRLATHNLPAGLYALRLWLDERYLGSKRVLVVRGQE